MDNPGSRSLETAGHKVGGLPMLDASKDDGGAGSGSDDAGELHVPISSLSQLELDRARDLEDRRRELHPEDARSQPRSRPSRGKSKTVGNETLFKVLVAFVIVTYVIFFTVAVARMTTIPLEGSAASVVRRVKAPSLRPKVSWLEPISEMAGGMINKIFHFHWMGLFGRYHGYGGAQGLQRSAAVLAEERYAAQVAREAVQAAKDRANAAAFSKGRLEAELADALPEVDHDDTADSLRREGEGEKEDQEEGEEEEEEEEDLWYVGVLLALFGTMVAAVGNHLVTLAHKMSLDEESRHRVAKFPPPAQWARAMLPRNKVARRQVLAYTSRPSVMCWLGGNVAITILGTLLTLMSLALASQSLLAPLSGLTIVWNALLATTKWFGGVTLTHKDIFATLLTLMGCVLIVGGGPRVTKHYQLEELVLMFGGRPFQIYSIAAIAGIAYLRALAGQSDVNKRQLARGMMPGIMGGFNNVLAKAAVELIGQFTIFSSASSITLFVVWIAVAFCQLNWINFALEQFEPLFIVPVYQATLLLSSTLCGALYYGDFANLSFRQYVTFGAGVLAIVVGVGLLASASAKQDKSASSPAQSPVFKQANTKKREQVGRQPWSRRSAFQQTPKRRDISNHQHQG
ncbi:Hypothetical Protein FCC1311_024182 [Hondaea fermentalgiana]|uniref:Uncharacterized protein n=1 Tax=Hondaea fermentalgiana TaxID=2315210 RepID=A0A2R5G590_9STRA|nr:Hypothetical Protein FCC1311_024182 [Hondaea fermentalgiana]|eukprot:GBG26197.1 Hypothetical Protein FCC1311_024182 [Hondaea fermentalgiana]